MDSYKFYTLYKQQPVNTDFLIDTQGLVSFTKNGKACPPT